MRGPLRRLYWVLRPSKSRRMFDYDRRLLVNPYLAEQEAATSDLESAIARTGFSLGYPAWNLLYYTLLCSLPRSGRPVVVETGTNRGFSTIVLAQALRDAGTPSVVRTVDIDPEVVKLAEQNLARAGLSDLVRFSVQDSLQFLAALRAEVDQIDFALLDGDHSAEHVLAEFELVRPLVARCGGKVYFDNTSAGGVAEALRRIRATHGGNLVEFANCSWAPPGNAVWQP
jgi:predicted O-methyltransferase YrrM